MGQFGEAVRFASEETFAVGAHRVPHRLIFRYDTERWDFRALAAQFFGTDDLEQLHRSPELNPLPEGEPLPSWRATRNSWEASKRLQAALRPLVSPLFGGLLFGHVSGFLHPVQGFQTQAAIRVNFHGSKQILRMHRDSEYGQTEGHVNLWLPVTKVGGTNSMYLETNVGAEDFAPLELAYGEACIFRGTDLTHGTVDNLSGSTRISYDIRFRLQQPDEDG